MSMLMHPLFQSPTLRACLFAVFLFAPLTAGAAPVTYSFTSGSAVIRASLAGQSDSILLGESAVQIPLVSIQAVVDSEAGTGFGRLESFEIVGANFSVELDTSQVGVSHLDVISPTISSVTGSDLNMFGQFALETTVAAQIAGTFAGGAPFGPAAVASAGNSGVAVGILFTSPDEVMIQVLGVSVASFDEFGNPDPTAPQIELTSDFTFIGTAVTAIPEPSAAVVFAVGLLAAGSSLRKPRA
jgi:hypothetical protein